MTRKDILERAEKCVNGDRDQQYGSPEENFENIAQYWGVYLSMDLTAQDVANMMVLFKIARTQGGGSGSIDNYIDICGYAACGGEIFSNNVAIPNESTKEKKEETKFPTCDTCVFGDSDGDIPCWGCLTNGVGIPTNYIAREGAPAIPDKAAVFLKKVENLYKNTSSDREVAHILGFNGTVPFREAFKEAKRQRRDDFARQIQHLLNLGYSVEDIARYLNSDVNRITWLMDSEKTN